MYIKFFFPQKSVKKNNLKEWKAVDLHGNFSCTEVLPGKGRSASWNASQLSSKESREKYWFIFVIWLGICQKPSLSSLADSGKNSPCIADGFTVWFITSQELMGLGAGLIVYPTSFPMPFRCIYSNLNYVLIEWSITDHFANLGPCLKILPNF